MAKKRTSPTKLTLDRLRNEGYMPAVVECWNAHSRIRQDMFGFVDIVAIHPLHKRILFVQATSHTNVSSRVNKIIGQCAGEALACVDAGAAIEVWGWQKPKHRWQVTVRGVERQEIVSGEANRSRRSKRKAKADQKDLEF